MINNNFTIEDIHKIRYANYEKTKDLNPLQLIKVSIDRSNAIIERLNELKKNNNRLNH